MKIEATFSREKETKNTFRYLEDGDEGKIGMIYIPKSSLPKPAPDRIKVTVEPLNSNGTGKKPSKVATGE